MTNSNENPDFTDLDGNISFPWSDYTLPDDYHPRIVRPHNYDGCSPVSGSGNSAMTDPFDINQTTPTEFLIDNKSPRPGKVHQTPPCRSPGLTSSNSAGFALAEIDGDTDVSILDEKWANDVHRAADYHFNLDMGFFGVASPPASYKVTDWMSRESPGVPIRRNSSDSSDPTTSTSPRSIPNSPRWILIEGQCFSFSPRGSIPNSPPQSPLYKRQSARQKKVFEDINEHAVFRPDDFLQNKKVYDLIPMSGKLIVFDKRLLVRKAFNALIANGTRAAPIWDSTAQEHTGMLTITDFISILNHCYNEKNHQDIEKIIENQTIADWKEISEKGSSNSRLISIDPTESLFSAAKLLLENKIHRLPVIDPRSGNTLYIVTHKRILNYLYPYIIESSLDPYFHCSITELGIGTYEAVKQLTYDSKLTEAISFFAKTRVSAIPLVNVKKEVIDIYARFDVITLASRGKYNNVNMVIKDCLQLRSTQAVHVQTCKSDDTLITVIKKIYSAQVHRLVVVNDQHHVIGLVSLSDLFRFLVLRFDQLQPEMLQDLQFVTGDNFEFG